MLVADLGVGKTTFVQGFVRRLGVSDAALSPTFILAQTFHGKIPIHHLDFYRATLKELLEMGIQDYFMGGGALEKGVMLIEWADRAPSLWPHDYVELQMKLDPKSKARTLVFNGVGPRGRKLVQGLS